MKSQRFKNGLLKVFPTFFLVVVVSFLLSVLSFFFAFEQQFLLETVWNEFFFSPSKFTQMTSQEEKKATFFLFPVLKGRNILFLVHNLKKTRQTNFPDLILECTKKVNKLCGLLDTVTYYYFPGDHGCIDQFVKSISNGNVK